MAPATLRDRVSRLMPQARDDLARMVALRSVYDPRLPAPDDCDRMVDLTLELLSGVGATDAAAYPTSDGSKVVCGHIDGPPGAPTALLYFHHDVQPELDDEAWESPPWTLTERNGRWYGRGAADCKGNIAAHLTALRALGGELPVNVTIVGEGSEELGDGGLDDFVRARADLLRADVILVCDSGNAAVGVPSLTTTLRGVVEITVSVRALDGPVHSGKFGGAAPDALAALIAMLATLRDGRGNTTVHGLANDQRWDGTTCTSDQFRRDAGVLDDVDLLGDDTASMIWARPAVTVLGIDCPPVVGSVGAIQGEARARVSLRVPPGMDAGVAQDALMEHLRVAAPWHVRVECTPDFVGAPFAGSVDGPGFRAMADAMQDAYGRQVTLQGEGGSIPLCNVLQETFPETEIMLLGVEEPLCRIHAPNESVDPGEIEHMALVEAVFLQRLAAGRRASA